MTTDSVPPKGDEDYNLGVEALRAALKCQEAQVTRTSLLLEQAVAILHDDREPHEAAGDRAQRFRGVAVLLHTAALELAVIAGWLEAEHAVELGS